MRQILVLCVLVVLAACATDVHTGTDRQAGAERAPLAVAANAASVSVWQERQRAGATQHALTVRETGSVVATGTCAAQRMAFRFEADAVQIDVARETVELAVTGYGRDALEPVAAPAERPTVDGAEIRYDRGTITEWYVNGPVGLEQGFTLHERLDGTAPARIALSVTGLTAELRGERVALRDERGRVHAWYGRLHVTDADAQVTPSRLSVADGTITIHIDDTHARYPIDVDPFVWLEHVKVTASDAEADDEFGAVVIQGDTLVVGAHFEDSVASNAGAVYIYDRNQGGAEQWGEVKKITADDLTADDEFGFSVALDGDTLVVGARHDVASESGAAYVFERNVGGANNWGQTKKLVGSDTAAGDQFGEGVAISGDVIVVGARRNATQSVGAAYVFERDLNGLGQWGERTKINADDAEIRDEFGSAVAIDGDTVIIAAVAEDGATSNEGAAYIFQRDEPTANSWGQVKKLVSEFSQNSGFFGGSVAIHGDVAVVGAANEDTEAGAAYIFERNAGGMDNWGRVKRVIGTDTGASDFFGSAAAVRGDIVAIGARHQSSAGVEAGAAYLFSRNEGGINNWGQLDKLVANDGSVGARFGTHATMSDDTLIVSANSDDVIADNAGATYVFLLKGEDGETCTSAARCESGFCVDGYCCNQACGDGADDCQACDVLASEGTCTPLPTTTVCRASAGMCDVAETCDGASSDCPADAFETGTVCRPAAAACDAEETCDGTSADCPADALATADTVCRPAASDCDIAEACNGTDTACPTDELASEGVTCDGGTCSSGVCVEDEEPVPDEPEVIDDGCGCRVVGDPTPAAPKAPWLLFAAGLAILRRQRG